MFEVLSGFADDVLAVSAKGRLTAQDYEKTLAPAAEEKMRTHRPLKLFFYLGQEFDGLESGAVVQDFRLGIAHWSDWGRIAVVTDNGLLRDAIGFFALIFHHPLRLFFTADYGKAKAWLQEEALPAAEARPSAASGRGP